MESILENFKWLSEPAAQQWLDSLSAVDGEVPMGMRKKMREALGTERAILVSQQVDLRQRARVKFEKCSDMLFTKRGLEQSTDEHIALYKSQQIPEEHRVADLCCGIGGDLIRLAESHRATGFDLDPVMCHVAAHNCRTHGVSANVRHLDVTADPNELAEFDFLHADPDRRVSTNRNTQVEAYEPPLSLFESSMERGVPMCIKIAPSASPPEYWVKQCKIEWIESRRECRQQVLWFGDNATAGRRVATEVDHTGMCWQVDGEVSEPESWSYSVERYIYEPRPSVLAAGIAESVARQFSLDAIWPDVVYWTSEKYHEVRWASVFEVEDVMPFDMTAIRNSLAKKRVGRLEIKKRVAEVDPQQLRRELKLQGDESRVLLLAGFNRKITAIIARRVESGLEPEVV
ncbi:MAG: class I SAM-dependent methyltransferase [Pirellulaceae bacterium]|mgnify:CR=1 FL=1